MPKFRMIQRQRHVATCGPIAVANAIKWHGTQTSYRTVMKFMAGIRVYIPRIGMFPEDTGKLLRDLKLRHRARRDLSLSELNKHLDDGGSLLLTYVTATDFLHAVFIDGRTENSYRVWNAVNHRTPWVGRDEMRAILRRSRASNQLYAYLFQLLRNKNTRVQTNTLVIR